MRKTVSKRLKEAAFSTGLRGKELRDAVKDLKKTWRCTPWNLRFDFRTKLAEMVNSKKAVTQHGAS